MIVGAQLYTVRDFCKTPEDLAETLKKIADIGYTSVQLSGTCAVKAEWLKKELDKNALICPISHTAPDRILNETEAVAAEHTVFGADYVGLGMYRFNKPEEGYTYTDFLEKYRPVAKKFKQLGKLFMYHNHAIEFMKIDGELVLDKIKNDFAPDELGFTLDTYWVQIGGGDPAAWLEKLSGRVPCIHLKDQGYGPVMLPIGEGNLNWDRIFLAAQTAGTKYMFVEQDKCNDEDPFDCLRRSYEFLKSRGLK